MNLNSVLIGSEEPRRLTDYYTRLFGKPTWEEGDLTPGRSARAGPQGGWQFCGVGGGGVGGDVEVAAGATAQRQGTRPPPIVANVDSLECPV